MTKRPTQMIPAEIPAEIQALFLDARVASVTEFLDGWVAKAYRWRTPGRAIHYVREGGAITASITQYDRRRRYGIGPRATAWSARGGRLASIS